MERKSKRLFPALEPYRVNEIHTGTLRHYYPKLIIRDLVEPMKTKRHLKIVMRIRYGIELSNKNRRKRSCGFCGDQGHISTICAKRKLNMQSLQDEQN